MQHEFSIRIRRFGHRILAFTATAVAVVGPGLACSTGTVAAATCENTALAPSTSALLTSAFAGAPDGLEGADYQRAIDLPDGRRLWTFQDAFVARPGAADRLVHNVAVVQDGACFDLIHGGSAANPSPWLAGEETVRHHRWFWPMGALLPGDGTIKVFLAEFVEHGQRYLSNSVPTATWLATIDATTFEQIDLAPAPNPGPALYGWSIAADDDFTYLYGHCYRQFGFSFVGHDVCTAEVTVARTSHDLAAPLTYWDGSTWVDDPAAAASIAPTKAPDGADRTVNPTQVTRVGDRWVAVTKDADWWGNRIYIDVADRPTGPWSTVRTVSVAVEDPDENTYFASVVAVAGDEIVIGLSHNRWDGVQSSVYRPTFTDLDVDAAILDAAVRAIRAPHVTA
jgi:hypothetical protein